jgi:hypothetical protein
VPAKAYFNGNGFTVRNPTLAIQAIMWELHMKQSTRLLKMLFIDERHEHRIAEMQRLSGRFFSDASNKKLEPFATPLNLLFYPRA